MKGISVDKQLAIITATVHKWTTTTCCQQVVINVVRKTASLRFVLSLLIANVLPIVLLWLLYCFFYGGEHKLNLLEIAIAGCLSLTVYCVSRFLHAALLFCEKNGWKKVGCDHIFDDLTEPKANLKQNSSAAHFLGGLFYLVLFLVTATILCCWRE